jgi:hypothetical protein
LVDHLLDDEFNRPRASLVRDLASRAEPFIKRRLLDLATRDEKGPVNTKPLPPISITGQNGSEDKRG